MSPAPNQTKVERHQQERRRVDGCVPHNRLSVDPSARAVAETEHLTEADRRLKDLVPRQQHDGPEHAAPEGGTTASVPEYWAAAMAQAA